MHVAIMKFIYLFGFFLISGLLGCVAPQQASNLNQRVTQLEMNNSALAAALKRSEAKLAAISSELESTSDNRLQTHTDVRDRYAELFETVNQIRMELQALRGKVEEADYAIDKSRQTGTTAVQEQEARLKRMEEIGLRNKERIDRIEQVLNFEAPKTVTPPTKDPPKPTPSPVKKDLSEVELYDTAKQALDKGEFDAARDRFNEFIKRFPKSANADNAQFWIGETYYREKWYEKAIMEYQKVIESYPDGNKVAAALLKQGLSFFNLNEKANSRLILKELIKKYPTSSEAKIAKEKLDTFN